MLISMMFHKSNHLTSDTNKLVPVLALSLLFLIVGCTKKVEKTVDLRPNVFLITVDSQRNDMIGAYGNADVLTPNWDRLSRESHLFTRVYTSSPYTVPALSSIMTGLLPQQHNARNVINKTESGKTMLDIPLPSEIDTWAESFEKKGYGTFAITGGFTTKGSFSGLNQGFEVYDDSFEGIFRPADEVNNRTVMKLKENTERPFFLWVHYYDTHFPYNGDTEYKKYYETCDLNISVPKEPIMLSKVVREVVGDDVTEESVRKVVTEYMSAVSAVDSRLGVLIRTIREHGKTKRNHLILTADHGEGLGEHGELFSHGSNLYDTTIRVPLLMHVPRGKKAETSIYTKLVRSVDILPTIEDILGSARKDANLAGTSLKNLLKEDSQSASLVGYAESKIISLDNDDRILSIITDTEKLIAANEDGKSISTVFDLNSDPSESEPLKIEGEQLSTLRQKLMEFMALQKIVKVDETKSAPQDEDTKNKLKSLGYLGD